MTFDQTEQPEETGEIQPAFRASKLISAAALAGALIIFIFLLSLAF